MNAKHLLTAGFAAACIASQSLADTQPMIPMQVELVKPLGFRTKAGLDNTIPFVMADRNYLQPGYKVELLAAVTSGGAPSKIYTPDTFCVAEYGGKVGYVRCDDASSMKPVTPTTASSGAFVPWPTTNSFGVSCGDLASCQKFCAKACDIPSNPKQTSCPRLGSGDGMTSNVQALPSFKHLTPKTDDKCDGKICSKTWASCTTNADCGLRATPAVIKGLQDLDTILDTQYPGYSVEIGSCWRDGVNEAKGECYSIANGHDPGAGTWMRPGASPHSSGAACDLYLHGKQQTFHASPKDGICEGYDANNATLKAASAKMDEIMEKAGAVRLKYEPWHYEWNGSSACKCKGAECSAKYWPPQCSHAQCVK